MRSDAAAYPNIDIERSALLQIWKGVSVGDILDGNGGTPVDVSPNATSCTMTESMLRAKLAFNDEFITCSDQPKTGDILTVQTDGTWRFLGIIDSVDQFFESRGMRHVSITSRSREGVGGWKRRYTTSSIYPLGTNYNTMLEDICELLMAISSSEHAFPQLNLNVPHTNSQFMDETPWSMLTTILEAARMQPMVNVLNQVTAFSTDILRPTDIYVDTERVINLTGGAQRLTVGRVRLRWLDPVLRRATQQAQLLYNTSMTAGFFKLRQTEETWWSEDHRQRADNIVFEIVSSVNAGIVPVAEEEFEVIDEYHGEITLTTYWFTALLFWMATVTLLATAYTPDTQSGVQCDPNTGVQINVAPTTPVGRISEMAALITILVIMMSIGVGKYEIYGTPYDYVHNKNTTLAYADNFPAWLMGEREMNNDLIIGEAHAQDVAVSALSYLSASAYSFGVILVDDPRIEKGDILEFEDGTRMLVHSFANNFTRGQAATIRVNGIRV